MSEIPEKFYSEKRSTNLGFSSVVVSVPPTHVAGELERAKTLPPDPQTEFAIIDPVVYERDTVFVSALNQALAKRPPDDREILIFIHGYNNSTSDAVLRISQFVEDTGFNGVPVLFSWASANKTTQYVYDLNSVLAARPMLLEAAGILDRANASGFNIFAHSMGGMLAMETIVKAVDRNNGRLSGRINNIMLAAPDIDLDVFRSQLTQLPESDRDIFVFTSNDDKALGFSQFISGGIERVGSADSDELAELGVTVIDLSQIEESSSGGHAKFTESPEVVQLIGISLEGNNYRGTGGPSFTDYLYGLPITVIGEAGSQNRIILVPDSGRR